MTISLLFSTSISANSFLVLSTCNIIESILESAAVLVLVLLKNGLALLAVNWTDYVPGEFVNRIAKAIKQWKLRRISEILLSFKLIIA